MPDWNRIFPAADHRWIMGLRQGELDDFFASADPTGAMCREHVFWLDEDLEKYSAVTPIAKPALHETVELARSLGAPIEPQEDDIVNLKNLARVWEPDLVWMHPNASGTYCLAGGIVCFPSSWALREKLSLPMREVHELVPDLNAALAQKIDTFLTRQNPGVAWRRENWSLARDGNLNHHPTRPRRRLDESITLEEVWVRLEHQLLFKLPSSGSILFGIRVERIPLKLVADDPLASARFVRILKTIHEPAAAYKGFATARSALISLLNSRHPEPPQSPKSAVAKSDKS